MKGVRASIRYAKALMSLAIEKKQVDAIVADAKMIQNLIKESDDLRVFLASPLIRMDQKRAILNSLFSGKVNALTLSFMDQIVSHGREASTATIFEKFIDLYNTNNNIAQVKVSSANPLSDSSRKQLLDMLKNKYQFAQIELDESVNADLIGGLVIRIGDQQLDSSIRRQLQNIEKELVQAK